MNERMHLIVSGRVQGVGFRAFVQQTARQLGVTGWVRNLGADRVEILAEGRRPALEALLAQALRGPRWARVDKHTVQWAPARGDQTDFHIRASR